MNSGWYVDPAGRYEQRYYDALKQWTTTVRSADGSYQIRDNIPLNALEQASRPRLGAAAKPGSAPADWYSDPTGRSLERYFDGLRWSQRVRGASMAELVDPGEVPSGVPDQLRAPGWYPDPTGRCDERRFDGFRWTDAVRTKAGVELIDPAGDFELAPERHSLTPGAPAPVNRNHKPLPAGAIYAAAAGLSGVAGLLVGGTIVDGVIGALFGGLFWGTIALGIAALIRAAVRS